MNLWSIYIHFTGEVEEVERLLCRLRRYTLEEEAVDEVRWKLMNAGVFTVKSMFKALQMSTLESFPWRRSCVPS